LTRARRLEHGKAVAVGGRRREFLHGIAVQRDSGAWKGPGGPQVARHDVPGTVDVELGGKRDVRNQDVAPGGPVASVALDVECRVGRIVAPAVVFVPVEPFLVIVPVRRLVALVGDAHRREDPLAEA
jgi:hypothetical protein